MAMVDSAPGSPEPLKQARPHSYFGAPSPEQTHKSRPQSMMYRPPPRSQSRMSQSSYSGKQGASRVSDDEGKTAVRVGMSDFLQLSICSYETLTACVVVRVRPPLNASDPGYDLIPQRFQRSTVDVTAPTSLGVESPQGRKLFIFDRVFGEDSTQKGIWEYLHDSVDSFLQGYNVSILAYGQSGSGKSYTMGTSGPGEQRDPSMKGVIPRAAQHLFEHLEGPTAHSRQNSGLKSPNRYSVTSLNQILQNSKMGSDKNWQMSVTYVEIYNEQPRDLLLDEGTPQFERANVQIREDPKGRIFVEGLRSVQVNSIEELMTILNRGSTIRQTDATAINARSSRSHAVFTINLRQNKPQGPTALKDKRASVPVDSLTDSAVAVESKLHFVDLAGSERLKNTGATGDRAREGISINAGLASLGKVISQLSTRSASSYVSYRDSKLTRMLQDSLGGNAITYMIACVTPAEFHLSETLNTVQYAQRARNIQSKPKIQQVQDDADKQALIDRLRSEVAFLRSQIRSAESGDRRTGPHTERMSRPSERENEIQNQLLDVQESYTSLSQRHAKLISELANSDHDQNQHPVAGESAVDRLKRSQAHQQQIEQMVLEYEKTIQSLENNLSNTRGSLAQTESNLLERESKCAYIETMNTQLHSRVQKLMDRESNMEQYLRDLEARLEDQSSGGEKNDALMSDLRKEIARIRENETNAEDYICTLEERLAEADQDMETIQREVERLEHLVERQRSLGKLDNLLYELDHVQRNDRKQDKNVAKTAEKVVNMPNGVHESDGDPTRSAEDIELPIADDDELANPELVNGEADPVDDEDGLEQLEHLTAVSPQRTTKQADSRPSPAQSKFVAEKFEAVSQELFDLRLEHESTVNQYDLLEAKYHEALRTLAEMQDSIDEARHTPSSRRSQEVNPRPASFLEDAREMDPTTGGHLSSSRSLSSELSLAGQSLTSTETDITPVSKQPVSSEIATKEIERLQSLLAEHEKGMNEVTEQYVQLQAEHKDTLSTVEKLKSEVSRNRPASPGALGPGMFRRMASQSSSVDKGQRSMVSLRTILAEDLDGKPDRLETAEQHLSTANHELQARMERIHALEAEVKNAKKEMDLKTQIISGLTRERNSMKAGSPVDLSMVSQMRDQLIQKETELKSLHEGYYKREQELQEELRAVSFDRSRQTSPRGRFSPQPDNRVRSLEAQLQELSSSHQSAEQSAQLSAKQLSMAKAELEAAQASIQTLKTSGQNSSDGDNAFERAAAATAMQHERENYQDLIEDLKESLQEEQKLSSSQKAKIAELVQLHSTVSRDATVLSEKVKAREKELSQIRPRIEDLQNQLNEAKKHTEFHKKGLESLQDAHANEVEEMKLTHGGILASYDDEFAEMTAKHEKLLKSMNNHKDNDKTSIVTLIESAQAALGHSTSPNMLANHIQDLAEEKRAHESTVKRLNATNGELERQLGGRHSLQELEHELEDANTKIANFQKTIRDLANEVGNHEETIREKDEMIKKHEAAAEGLKEELGKRANLIEELEQQLQSSFDQHHNRISVVQAQGNQALVDAQSRIAALEQDLGQRNSYNESDQGSRTHTMKSPRPTSPLSKEDQQRANSLSNLRKSASIASLPSPPPAIPLPPLPTLPGIQNAQASNPSPPNSRHASKEVQSPTTPHQNTTTRQDQANSQALRRQSALIEEQEGRIRTIEKQLHAEKQLTATLEEALVDLETQSNKLRADADGWKKKAWAMEEELGSLRKERKTERLSVQAVEEEVKKRREAEAARTQLEERMRLLQGDMGKKRRKGATLNCF